jgi:cell division protein ZapA (FtsZ GTPase activity inhibitor)
MSNQDNEDQEHDVRERIVSLIQATGRAGKKQLTKEELQELKNVASRLDQMLNAAADEDRQALRSAAARLDQLLQDIGTGKDVTRALRRRRDSQRGES